MYSIEIYGTAGNDKIRCRFIGILEPSCSEDKILKDAQVRMVTSVPVPYGTHLNRYWVRTSTGTIRTYVLVSVCSEYHSAR